MEKSIQLKELIDATECLVMPDAYDPLSARIIEQSGFKAVQCSGYSFSLAACRKNEIDITRVSLPTIAICATIKALTGACEGLKTGTFTSLLDQGRLCTGQEIGKLIGA